MLDGGNSSLERVARMLVIGAFAECSIIHFALKSVVIFVDTAPCFFFRWLLRLHGVFRKAVLPGDVVVLLLVGIEARECKPNLHTSPYIALGGESRKSSTEDIALLTFVENGEALRLLKSAISRADRVRTERVGVLREVAE